MFTTTKTILLFSLPLAVSCSSPSSSPGTTSLSAAVSVSDVKEIPALDRTRYPDSLGLVYQGSLATFFWLQNDPSSPTYADLQRSVRTGMQRGLAGEILTSSMQNVDPMPETEPPVDVLLKNSGQWTQLMAEYSAVSAEYAGVLGTTLATYNSDPARMQSVSDAAAAVEAGLSATTTSHAVTALRNPPPPANQRVMQQGRYFADAMKDRDRAYLVKSAHNLDQAIASRNATAYANAFADLFYMQNDIVSSKDAHEALAVAHVDNLLRGQPLDTVIAKNVTTTPDPDRPMSMEQLCLLNQINLISNNTSVSRQALVAALLLVNEDHRQAEPDATLTPSVIWSHVSDLNWLVTRFVTLKADGTTEAQFRSQVDAIVATI